VDSHEATSGGHGRDHVGRLTVGEDRHALPVQPNAEPSGQCRFGRAHPGPELGSPCGQLAPGHGLLEIEGADPTPDEALDGPAAPQRSTDVGGESPNVRSLAADDLQGRARSDERLDPDRTDDHLAGRPLHLDTGAGQLVESSPLVMNRRVHRGYLLDPAHEGATGLFERRPRKISDRSLRQHSATHVVRVRRQPKADRGEVLLVLVDEIGRELRRLAHEDRQHAGRVGVESARVPDAADAQPATNDRDDVE